MTIFFLTCHASDVPLDDAWLGPRERELSAGFRIEKRRRDWRLGRWTAKQALQRFQRRLDEPSTSPNAVELLAAPDGAPEFHGLDPHAPVQVSLSHSGGVGVCALGRLPRKAASSAQINSDIGSGIDSAIGCDLEAIEPRSEVFLSDFFTAREQAAFARAPTAARDLLIALVWSAKESALKVLRCGLRRDTRSVEVSIEALEEDALALAPKALHRTEFHAFEVRDLEQELRFTGWWRQYDGRIMTIAVGSYSAAHPCRTPWVPMSPPIDLG
ncbi:MAG: 4'-phosphopantetheinyl transferase superfamily protein [Deltaproteobacteria bacterium]|nr:4'-phosphopantetheinyl transferase superfamily protein [Deltaproteobacteria bacterium]